MSIASWLSDVVGTMHENAQKFRQMFTPEVEPSPDPLLPSLEWIVNHQLKGEERAAAIRVLGWLNRNSEHARFNSGVFMEIAGPTSEERKAGSLIFREMRDACICDVGQPYMIFSRGIGSYSLLKPFRYQKWFQQQGW